MGTASICDDPIRLRCESNHLIGKASPKLRLAQLNLDFPIPSEFRVSDCRLPSLSYVSLAKAGECSLCQAITNTILNKSGIRVS